MVIWHANHLMEAMLVFLCLPVTDAQSPRPISLSTSVFDCTDPSIVTETACMSSVNCEWTASSDGQIPLCIYRHNLENSTTSPSSKPTRMAKAAKSIRTRRPTPAPSRSPHPSVASTNAPTREFISSTQAPTDPPTTYPSRHPSMLPTDAPSGEVTKKNTINPTNPPTSLLTDSPSRRPSMFPTSEPTRKQTRYPTNTPTSLPSESGVAISFILMGDIPYSLNDRYCLNKQLRELDPSSIEHPYNFIIHVGDIKSGQVACESSSYSDVADIFSHSSNTVHYDPRDVFFIVGDNEWTDCASRTKGFMWWMNNFGNGQKRNGENTGPNPNGFGTFSDSKMRATLEYDWQDNSGSSSVYPTSATNFAFFYNKVLFVGINQVGGGTVGDEATRVKNNFEWTKTKMAKYAAQGMRTLVIFAHAPMTGARLAYFGSPFKLLLLDDYPEVLVLYAHGDGHTYSFQRDINNPNLYDLQCDSGWTGDPLLITVLREPNEDDALKIDRRAGRYSGGCKPGSSDQEKTWG